MTECCRDYPLALGLMQVLHARAIDLRDQSSGRAVSHQAVELMDAGLQTVLATGQYQFIASAWLARAALNRRRTDLDEARRDLACAVDLIESCELKRHQIEWQLEKVELLVTESELGHKQSAACLLEASLELDVARQLLHEVEGYEAGWRRFRALKKQLMKSHK
ncbi:hypothetical protein GC176_13760 [bacterium]|nr:hypothetical protein [bacterium]